MSRKRSFSDKFWNDKHGQFTVWQKPNWLLVTWFACFVINIVIPAGGLQRFIGSVGGLAIFVWAIMELGWGVNIFRKTLGLCVLMLFAASYFL